MMYCIFNPAMNNRLKGMFLQDNPTKNTLYEDGTGHSDDTGDVRVDSLPGYVRQDIEDISMPKEVEGKAGLASVDEESTLVKDNAVEEDGVSFGNDGSNLEFDTYFYPYYGMLNEDGKTLYRQIYANIDSLTQVFKPVIPCTVEEFKKAHMAVYNDHPELFWIGVGFSCKYLADGNCVEVNIHFNETADNIEASKKSYKEAMQPYLNLAMFKTSDADKEKAVHDALIDNVRYDVSAPCNQTAYSALVNKETVCAGYARAFQNIMMELGIPCYYCTGYSGEDHAWNIICIDGRFYNVDTTWDDTEPHTYSYYNKSDARLSKTHLRTGMSVNLPPCLDEFEEPEGEESSDSDTPVSDALETAEDINDSVQDKIKSADDITRDALRGFINDNPSKPLDYENNGRNAGEDKEEGQPEADTSMFGGYFSQDDLNHAGLDAQSVIIDLDGYYADCLEMIKRGGIGETSFDNIVPMALWKVIEANYSNGAYKTGYMNEALSELGATEYKIEVQPERINGIFVRIYHSVVTG